MKWFVIIPFAVMLFSLSSTANSQSSFKGQDITEWKFHDEIVEGGTIRPEGTRIRARSTGASRSLVKIRGHFVPEMLKSVEDI